MKLRFGLINHLKACKSIKASFNPWIPGTKSLRQAIQHLSNPKLKLTNEKCKFQFDVRSDAVEPQMEVIFNDDTKAVFKTKELTFMDINRVFQRLSNIKHVEKEEKEKN